MNATNRRRHMGRLTRGTFAAVGPLLALKPIAAGAATQPYVSVHPDAGSVNGEYWADCSVAEASAYGRDMAMAKKFRHVTQTTLAIL